VAIRRHYNNNSAVVSTVGSMSNVATTVTVSDASTFPASFPWTALIDAGLATAEVVLVTAAAGAVLTITRGYDGTAAQTHASAATFAHVAVQADYDEANAHHVATSAVHGVAGTVVGTTDAQTLSNKTLASPVATGTIAGVNETLSGTLAVTGTSNLTGAVTAGAGVTVTGAISATTTVTATGAVTGGSVVTGGTVAATGAATAASFTANANGVVAGVVVPKTYTTEAAATAALPSPTTGTQVFLTAPANGGLPGPFYWNGSAWLPVNMATARGQWTQTTGVGQALTNGGFTTLTGYGADFTDTTGGSMNLATGIWTCGANGAGQYKISGAATSTSGGTRLLAAIQKNGVSVLAAYDTGTTVTNATAVMPEKEIGIAASDTILITVNVNAAGLVTASTNASTSFLRIERVS
jgi:hypothetical protein